MGLVNDYSTASKFFKAQDIAGVQVVMTIRAVGQEQFDDGRTQPTIEFNETEKILGLNKTNREKLAELFGSPDEATGVLDVQPEQIIGQQICLYKSTTQMREGGTVPCVRIRSAQAIQQRAQAPQRPAAGAARPRQQAPAAGGQPRQQAQAQPRQATGGARPRQAQQPVQQQPQAQPDYEPEPGSFDGENDLGDNAPFG